MSSAILIPQSGEQSLAPVDPDHPQQEREREISDAQQDCPDLIQYVRKTVQAIKSDRETEWRRILNAQIRCKMYFDDRQYGDITPEGVWKDFDRKPGDIRPIDNRYKVELEKILMEAARAFPEYTVKAADKNDTVMAEAAKFAQSRLNANRKKLVKPTFKLREFQSLLVNAITYRYTSFDDDAEDGPYIKKAQKTERETKAGYKLKIVSGSHEKVKAGRPNTRHVDATMVRISLNARESVADSPYLVYSQTVERCRLQAAYPHMKIPTSTEASLQSQYHTDVESSPSNSAEGGSLNRAPAKAEGGDQFENIQFDLVWIDPYVYADYTAQREERLLGGRVIPEGATLAELFPDGMCVAMAGERILDMYPENKNKKWCFCVYGIREWALHGSGTNALLGPQDTRNDLLAYMIANVFYNGAPREFVRANGLTGNQLPVLNQVSVVTNVPDDKPVKGWAYDKAEASPLPNQTLDLYQNSAGAMQEGAGTSSFSAEGSAADIKAQGTATGIAAIRDMSVGRMGPNLMLWADMESEHGFQLLEHEKDNYPPDYFHKMANQPIATEKSDGSLSFSKEGIEAFINCNIRSDFEIEPVPGSWMPRTEAEEQAKLAGFTKLVGEITSQIPPNPLTGQPDPRAEELIAVAARVFGQDINIDGWTATERVAADRLRQYAKTVGVMEKNGAKLPPGPKPPAEAPPDGSHPLDGLKPAPPNQLVQVAIQMTPQAAMNPEMDQHPAFIAFYKEWWVSDEGGSASPLLRAVVEQLVIDHRSRGMVYTAQQMSLDKMAAEAPQMVAAQATAQESQGGEQSSKQKISESINYKDAPDDIRRQMEAQAGLEPSQLPPEQQDDGTAAEAAKAQSTLAIQQHKAELEQETARQTTELEMEQQEQAAVLKEAEAQSNHERETDKQSREHLHQEGLKGAEMAHKSISQSQDHAHQAATTERQQEGQKELAKMKPKGTGK